MRGSKQARSRPIRKQSPASALIAPSASAHASAACPPPICTVDKQYAPSNATNWCLSSHGHPPSGRLPALGFFSSRLLLLSRCRQLLVHGRQFLRLSSTLAEPARNFLAVFFTEHLKFRAPRGILSVVLRHCVVVLR